MIDRSATLLRITSAFIFRTFLTNFQHILSIWPFKAWHSSEVEEVSSSSPIYESFAWPSVNSDLRVLHKKFRSWTELLISLVFAEHSYRLYTFAFSFTMNIALITSVYRSSKCSFSTRLGLGYSQQRWMPLNQVFFMLIGQDCLCCQGPAGNL